MLFSNYFLGMGATVVYRGGVTTETLKAVMSELGKRGRGVKKRRSKEHYQKAAEKAWSPRGRRTRKQNALRKAALAVP
jgi:hypothetical protein